MQLSIAISKKMCYYNSVERQENKIKKAVRPQPRNTNRRQSKKKGKGIITQFPKWYKVMKIIRIKTYDNKNIFIEQAISSKNDVLKVIETLKKYISGLRSDLMNERLIYQRENREIELINAINYYDSIVESLERG